MKRIVVAVDGSPGAEEAVGAAIELARALDASLLFVASRPSPIPILGDPYYQRKLTGDLAKVRPAVDAALATAADAGVPADSEVLEGDPAAVILDVASAWDADLIVVGSRGLGSFAGTLLGSVSRAVVQDADRPVLVVKAHAQAARVDHDGRLRSVAP